MTHFIILTPATWTIYFHPQVRCLESKHSFLLEGVWRSLADCEHVFYFCPDVKLFWRGVLHFISEIQDLAHDFYFLLEIS